jgi:Major Facilitator Superfamily
LVEHTTENRGVPGSSPGLAIGNGPARRGLFRGARRDRGGGPEARFAGHLLFVPQGLGAAIAISIAGSLTDKVGARRVVPVGVALATVGTLAYTQIALDTPYWYLAGALLLIGAGLGATITASMAAAFQGLERSQMAMATSTINVVQRVAGSLGTALLAVVLQRAIQDNLDGFHGGIEQAAGTRPLEAGGRRAQRRRDLAPALPPRYGEKIKAEAGRLLRGIRLTSALARTRGRKMRRERHRARPPRRTGTAGRVPAQPAAATSANRSRLQPSGEPTASRTVSQPWP